MCARNSAIRVIFSFVFLLAGFTPVLGQMKIGYVNSNLIMKQFKDAVEVSKKVNELAQQYEKERQQLQTELDNMNSQFEKQQALLSQERRTETLREIQDLYQRLLKYQEEKFGPQGELERRTKEFTDPVVKKIQGAIDKIGQQEGYDFIFDSVNANIVYAREEEYDITERVLAELNKSPLGAPSSTPATNSP